MIQYTEQLEREKLRPRRNRIGPLRLLSGRWRRLPDFIIAGAQKCGTTALHTYLEAHPDVTPARTKEIHFFDHNYHRGLRWYRAHFPSRLWAGTSTGEGSPSYLLHPLAPARIRADVPECRIIVLLRDPADRAYSHFQHNARKGREALTFEEAIEREEERLRGGIERALDDPGYFEDYCPFSYLLRGLYAAQLERWFPVFARERILVLESSELLANPAPTFGRVLEFLGLRPWDPEYRVHHHYGYEEIRPETRARLSEFFRPHNERLFTLLDWEEKWGHS